VNLRLALMAVVPNAEGLVLAFAIALRKISRTLMVLRTSRTDTGPPRTTLETPSQRMRRPQLGLGSTENLNLSVAAG